MLKHLNKDNSLETTLYPFKNCYMQLENFTCILLFLLCPNSIICHCTEMA